MADALDLLDTRRILRRVVDMGCYESLAVPPTFIIMEWRVVATAPSPSGVG